MYQPTPAGQAFQENGVWYQDYYVQDEATNSTVVKRYMHNGTDWVEAPVVKKIDLAKKIPNTPAGISLKKNVVNLDKTLVSLTKKSGIDLGNHRAKVAVIVDYSGSMRTLYNNGSVQRALTRLVPLGLRFDDNGEVDVWLFHDGFKRLDGMDLTNFDRYVTDVIARSGERYGCTSYAPVIKDAISKYEFEEPSDIPAFIMFITDGANDDKSATNRVIVDSSNYKMFIQFVGIGSDRFDYLRKLDDIGGRAVDNTGFISIGKFDDVSDEELYQALLEQYVDWLRAMHLR